LRIGFRGTKTYAKEGRGGKPSVQGRNLPPFPGKSCRLRTDGGLLIIVEKVLGGQEGNVGSGVNERSLVGGIGVGRRRSSHVTQGGGRGSQ